MTAEAKAVDKLSVEHRHLEKEKALVKAAKRAEDHALENAHEKYEHDMSSVERTLNKVVKKAIVEKAEFNQAVAHMKEKALTEKNKDLQLKLKDDKREQAIRHSA